jgi:hypothetical protein
MADQIIGAKVEIDTGSVKGMKAQLREANEELVKMSDRFGASSKEAVTAAKRVAGLKDAIGDAKNLVDQFNPDQKFRAFTTVIGGVASGFTALQGAMGLIGVEGEDVAKSLQKVQAAMAFSQGINQLGDLKDQLKNAATALSQLSIFQKVNAVANNLAAGAMRLFGISVSSTAASFTVLKTAIIATGIGALVVLLGTVISKVQEWTSANEDAAKAQEELNKKTLEFADAGLKGEQAYLDRSTKLLIAQAKARGASEEEIFKIEQTSRELRLQAQKRYLNEVRSVDEVAAQEAQAELKNQQNDIRVADYDHKATLLKQQQEANKKSAEERKRAAEEAQKEREKAEQDEFDRRLKSNDQANSLIVGGGTDQVSQLEVNESEALLAKEQADRLQEIEDERVAKQLENIAKIGDATAKGLSDEIAKKQAADQAQIVSDNAKKDAQISNMAAVGNALNAISELVGAQTVAGKALAIGASIINTYQGATKALAQGGFLGIATAAAVIATGLASVRKIISTPLPGATGSGSTGGASPPSLNTGAPIQPTQIGANTVTLDQRSLDAMENRVVKAFVVESEITDKQNRVRRIEAGSRFG